MGRRARLARQALRDSSPAYVARHVEAPASPPPPAPVALDPRHVRPPAPHPAKSLLRRQPLSPFAELGAVKRARTRLDVRQAAAVEAARAAGMTWQEVADALGLPLTTVYRQHRS